ncbi:MAG: flavodoxin [Pseudomonadota bacterium]
MNLSDLNVGLIFGTDTGNTEEIGDKIASVLAEHACPVEMINVVDASPEIIESFDMIIMGIPTWDFGGIQEDWEDFEDQIAQTKLTGKIVALYGLGDQRGYGDYFIDAVGWLHERVVKVGATVIGEWPTEGYDFEESLAANKDKSMFCGLAIDEDQQLELTDERISGWINLLISQLDQLQAA